MWDEERRRKKTNKTIVQLQEWFSFSWNGCSNDICTWSKWIHVKNHLNISLSVSDGAFFSISCLLFFFVEKMQQRARTFIEAKNVYNFFFLVCCLHIFSVLMYYCDRLNSCFLLLNYICSAHFVLSPWKELENFFIAHSIVIICCGGFSFFFLVHFFGLS